MKIPEKIQVGGQVLKTEICEEPHVIVGESETC